MAVNDCQKPTYIVAFNEDKTNYYNTFVGKVHSGEFIASFRTTEFDPDYPLDKDFKEFSLSNAVSFGSLSVNIIKLKCKDPGIISIYFQKWDFFGFTKDVDLGLSRYELIINAQFSDFQLPANVYIQIFNLVGNTSIDLTRIGGKRYDNDFYTKIYLSSNYLNGNYEIPVSNLTETAIALKIFNVGESTAKIAKEKENILALKNKIIIIPLKIITDKKYIKISSSKNNFYWDYHYSQVDDTNYLPSLSYRTKHYQRGKFAFIDNPYKYTKLQTNYYMFISVIHYNDEGAIFNYEYVNEKGENDSRESDNRESNNEENEINTKDIWFWIIVAAIAIVIIILILGVAICCCFCGKKRNESIININEQNIDKLVE